MVWYGEDYLNNIYSIIIYIYTLHRSSSLDENFHGRVRKFIATKADLLFSVEGKKKLRKGIDYGMPSNQEGMNRNSLYQG